VNPDHVIFSFLLFEESDHGFKSCLGNGYLLACLFCYVIVEALKWSAWVLPPI